MILLILYITKLQELLEVKKFIIDINSLLMVLLKQIINILNYLL